MIHTPFPKLFNTLSKEQFVMTRQRPLLVALLRRYRRRDYLA